MNLPLRAARQSVNDLAAFDLSKRSAEEIALQLACWKQQHKQQHADRPTQPRRAPPKFMPVVNPRAADHGIIAPPPAEPGALHYSASFVALLAAGGDKAGVPQIKVLPRPVPPKPVHRSKLRWILAGTASVLAVTAVAGTALWQGEMPWQFRSAQAPATIAMATVAVPPLDPLPAKPRTDIPATLGAVPPTPTPVVAESAIAVEVQPAIISVSTILTPLQDAIDAAPLPQTAAVTEMAQPHLAAILKPRVPVIQAPAKEPVVVETAAQLFVPHKFTPMPNLKAPVLVAPVVQMLQDQAAAPVQDHATQPDVSVPVAAPPVPEAKEVATDTPRPDALDQRGNDKAFGGAGNLPHGSVAADKPSGSTASGTDSSGSGSSGSGAGAGDGASGDGSGAGGTDGGTGGTDSGAGGSAGGGAGASGDGGSGGSDAGSGSGSGDSGGSGGSDAGSGGGSGDSGGSGGSDAGSGGGAGDGGGSSGSDAGSGGGSGDSGGGGAGGSGSGGGAGDSGGAGSGGGDAGSGGSGAGAGDSGGSSGGGDPAGGGASGGDPGSNGGGGGQ